MQIKIQNGIDNTSLQVGDYIYYVPSNSLSTIEGKIQQSNSTAAVKVGQVDSFSNDTITINNPAIDPASQTTPIGAGDFIMFAKDKSANNTSLIGYYAEVKLTNNSVSDAELFSLASEITISSK